MKNNMKFHNLLNNFSVTKLSKFTRFLPFVVVLIAIIVIVSLGATSGSYADAVGIGIDFTGGTILTVELTEADLEVKPYKEHKDDIMDAIEAIEYEGQSVIVSYAQELTDESTGDVSIVFRYKNVHDNDEQINAMNDLIRDTIDNMYPDNPGNVKYESIGSTAASDLLSKAGIALVVSIVLILVYIIIRFTLMSGFAAILALLHDVIVMFALTVICRVQINSNYIAAMITIIAYSINNTIIIFDRCREYLKPLKGQKNIDYKGIGDMAVRDSMTRSIYTTLTTMITVIFLAILGSDTIREFCVPIILGLCSGFFSAVFLAVPMWSSMSIAFDKFKAKHMKANAVNYDKPEEEQVVVEAGVKAPAPKANNNGKKNNNVVYKYSKKNTTFKKKK